MKKYNIDRKPLDKARRVYIDRIIANLRKKNISADIKNLMHSFIYLILNDDFNREISKIRTVLNIPKGGFPNDADYRKWKTKELINVLYFNVSEFIDEYKFCYAKHKPLIVELFKSYILLQDFLLDRVALADKNFNYHRIVGEFDAPSPVSGECNTNDFDSIYWEVYLLPTDNITQFRKSLQHYFSWMMPYHFEERFNKNLLEAKNADVISTYNSRIKKTTTLDIKINKKEAVVTLKFHSYLNTSTKDVLREYDKYKGELKKFQKKLKNNQRDKRTQFFDKKLKQYICYLDNLSAPAIDRKLYDKNARSTYSKRAESIRTDIKEMRRDISMSFYKKLSL